MYAEFDIDDIVKDQYSRFFKSKGILVEVGAAHPEILSFSKIFREDGWRCISVEPNPYFVEFHKKVGNEIYPYACADYIEENANFQITKWRYPEDGDLTYESFSSINIKQEYIDKEGDPGFIQNINVNITTLDLVLEEAKLEQEIDILIIDTEGWELEVMKGFNHTKYNPKVVILENYIHLESYNDYMDLIGYKLDKTVEYNYIYIKK